MMVERGKKILRDGRRKGGTENGKERGKQEGVRFSYFVLALLGKNEWFPGLLNQRTPSEAA